MKRPRPKLDARIFQALVEQSRDYALFLLDTDGYVTSWNAGAQRIKGYFPDEIIGEHFSKFYPRDAVEGGWPDFELKMAAREGRFEDEGWRVRKDGSRFWASVVITALRDEAGGHIGFSKITRDLSERKQQEEALRQSEERFRLLIEGVQDYAIYMVDPDGTVTSWNNGAQRITGYQRDEILGSHCSRFYTEEDAQAGRPWRALAEARNAGRAEDEGWRVRKDGSRFWARVVISSLTDEAGRLLGFAKVTQDLTERRHVQDLETAAKNVSEFIATLAHEIRNPLAPIRAAVQAMERLQPDDPRHLTLRAMIDRQSAHLTRIADDMIDITRITRGVLTIEHKPVEIEEVIRRSVEAAIPKIAQADHMFEVLCPEPAVVVGDVDRLTQIVTNLLNNAARYTPNGGHIWLEVAPAGRHVDIIVTDTGKGIDPTMVQRVFGMFIQADPTAPRAERGLGVGLALARRLAELHGGTLNAFSEGEGRGARFVLRLPMLEAGTAASPGSGQSAIDKAQDRPARQKRLLVVDDNVDAAESLEMLLRALGHEVRSVNDGPSALATVPDYAPDIIFLDIGMPDMDGYEVARQLAPLKRERGFRIVAVTGWGQAPDRQHSADAGFDLHLVKPVEMEELMSALDGAPAPSGGSTPD